MELASLFQSMHAEFKVIIIHRPGLGQKDLLVGGPRELFFVEEFLEKFLTWT